MSILAPDYMKKWTIKTWLRVSAVGLVLSAAWLINLLLGVWNLSHGAETRQFAAVLDGRNLDAGYFDRDAGTLMLCKGQAAEACKTYAVPAAIDFVPSQAGLIRFNRDKSAFQCVAGANNLDCKAIDPANAGLVIPISGATAYVLKGYNNDVTCTVSSGINWPICTTQRPMASIQEGALLFGDYTGKGHLEAIQVRNGVFQLCDLSAVMKSCATATGITGLSKFGGRVSSARGPGGLSQVIFAADNLASSCAWSGRRFNCETTDTGVPLANLRTWIVPTKDKDGVKGQEKLFVSSSAPLLNSSQQDAALSKMATLTDSVNRVRTSLICQYNGINPGLTTDTYSPGGCGGGDGPDPFDASNFAPNVIEVQAVEERPEPLPPITVTGTLFTVFTGPMWQFENVFDPGHAAPPPFNVAQCKAQCDADKTAGTSVCEIAGGIAVAVGATTTTAAMLAVGLRTFNPRSVYYVAVGGIAGTAALAGVVSSACASNNATRHLLCLNKCNNGGQ